MYGTSSFKFSDSWAVAPTPRCRGYVLVETGVGWQTPLPFEEPEDTERYYLLSAAIGALGAVGDGSDVPVLLKHLKDENYLCVCAAGALAKIGDERAVQPLIEVLTDNDFWVPRGQAAIALGDLGATAALSALYAAKEYEVEGSGERWDERALDAVRDAINRIEHPGADSSLTGQGYRFEMWGKW